MTTPLAPCPACQRHLRVDATTCPFCSAPARRQTAEPRADRIATHVSRAAIIAMGALAAAGCSSPAASDGTIAQPYGAPPTPTRLNWTLSASQSAIKMTDRAAFRLTVSVTNAGPFEIDPGHASISFRVNGQLSQAATDAFLNGNVTVDWARLAAGATATDAHDIGATLFDAPGSYVIELLVNGDAVSQVSVVVAAD